MTKYSYLGYKAEDLYVQEQKTLEEISSILGVSENTLSKWKKKAKWKEKRDSYLSFIPEYIKATASSPVPEKHLITTTQKPQNQMGVSHLSESRRLRMLKRMEVLKGASGMRGKALREYLKSVQVPVSTFWSWLKIYRKQGPKGLVDKYGRPKANISEEQKTIIKSIYLLPSHPTISTIYRTLQDTFPNCYPTYSAVRKFIQRGIPHDVVVPHQEEGTRGLVNHGGGVKGRSNMESLKDILDMVYEPGKAKKAIIRDFVTLCNSKGITPPSYGSIRYSIEKNYPSQDIIAEELRSGPILLKQHRNIGTHAFLPTGTQELDRVLGGGFHIPSSVILAGDPGVGKSTLMLQVVSSVAKARGSKSCIYFSAEQDISQIKKRIGEMGIYEGFYIEDTDSLEHIVQTIKKMRPKLIIVDSIKRLRTSAYTGTYDSPYYVSYCGKQLTRLSKETRSSIILINHMTKKGDMSGLKSFEHDVDVVLYFQGNPLSNIKMLYASKNRYGDTTEVGFFRMTERGLIEVDDIEYLFRQKRNRKVFGVSLVVVQKGQRILPLEIQSLVGKPISKPTINVTGLDKEQIIKMLRILKERLSIDLTNREITMTTTGEVELDYPYIQLAFFSAIMSNIKRVDVSKKVFIGEVDLTGSIRPFYGQKKLLNSILRIKDINGIFAPKPADPVEYLEDARITYADDIYSLSESMFGPAKSI